MQLVELAIELQKELMRLGDAFHSLGDSILQTGAFRSLRLFADRLEAWLRRRGL